MVSLFTLSMEQTSSYTSRSYRVAALWAGITDIPAKVFIDNLLPFCGTKDVISLGCTNKLLALVTTDETLWKRKLVVDYNFPVSETARTSGWKFIYRKSRNPRIFVWGCVTFSFFHDTRVSICSSMHSRVLAGIVQSEGQRQARVTAVSGGDPWVFSFSGRTSPSRCSCRQPRDKWRVSQSSIPMLNKYPHYSLFLYTDRACHALGSDGSVYVWGGCF